MTIVLIAIGSIWLFAFSYPDVTAMQKNFFFSLSKAGTYPGTILV